MGVNPTPVSLFIAYFLILNLRTAYRLYLALNTPYRLNTNQRASLAKAIFKNARSVSLYPYNRSQLTQKSVLLNKLTLQKELQNCVTKNVFWTKS